MKFKFRVKCALWLQIHTLFIHFGSLDLLVSCGVLTCCMTSVCLKLTWNWPFSSFYSGVALPHSAATGDSFPQVSFSLLNHECTLRQIRPADVVPLSFLSRWCALSSPRKVQYSSKFSTCVDAGSHCGASEMTLCYNLKKELRVQGWIAVFLLMNQIKSKNVVFTSVVFFYYWHLCDDVKHVTDKYAKTCEIRTHSTIFRFGMQC